MNKKEMLLELLKKDLIVSTPEALQSKLEFNQSLLKQIKESVEINTLSKPDASNTIMILAARMMMDGFIVEGLEALSFIDSDYIKNHLLNDLIKDPAFDKEIDTVLLVLEYLLPPTNTDSLLEGNKNLYV